MACTEGLSICEFQSTHLLRGATLSQTLKEQINKISIHAPLARCDCCTLDKTPYSSDFNPRTSCEVRHPTVPCLPYRNYFNPRTSCEVRRQAGTYVPFRVHFNPRTSCEVRPRPQQSWPIHPFFNPRTSCEVRPCIRQINRGCIGFSIHAPLARCDMEAYADGTAKAFSIHAPLARCDCYPRPAYKSCHFYNPRTSCEVRPIFITSPSPFSFFNPRTSCEVRPLATSYFACNSSFQSTHLLRGATYDNLRYRIGHNIFNPRTSCEVRLGFFTQIY